MSDYTIPIGLDPKIFAEFQKIENELDNMVASAKATGDSLSKALTDADAKADIFNKNLLISGTNIGKIQQAAKNAGKDLEAAFSPSKIKTSELDSKVNVFVAKMKDVIGKPIDFKFNLDQKAIDLLVVKLREAKGQTAQFELVLESAKAELATMGQGDAGFSKLAKQISEAERFLNVLKEDVQEISSVNDSGAILPDPIPEGAAENVVSFRQKLRELTEQLIALELAGKRDTEEFRTLAVEAGELRDQIQDTRQRISEIGSDTKGIDAAITGMRGLAGAFAVGQGALAAFGAQNEDAAEAIQKVQGAMAILQGIQEIANVLNKDSALIVYLETFARGSHTTAIVAETVAIEGETVATEAATVATEGFTLALLANPIVAVIAALVAITAAVYFFVKANNDAGLSVDQLNEKLKQQQDFLNEDFAIIARNQARREAELNEERRNQSELSKLKIDGLRERLIAERSNIEDQRKILLQSHGDDEKDVKFRQDLSDKINSLETGLKNTENEIRVESINLRRQRFDEEVKLELDLLKEKQLQANAEIAIRKQANDYLNQLSGLKIGELRDGEAKELAVIRQANVEKIKTLDDEGKARLRALNDTRRQLLLDIKVADENGKKVLELQIRDNAKQISLEKQAGQSRAELRKTILEAELIEEQKIREKYAQEERDFLFDIDVKLNSLRKESADKEIAQLTLTKNHELDLIERTNKSKEDKEIASIAVIQEFEKKKQDALLDFNLKQSDIEKLAGENKLMAQKGFFDKSRDGQALQNLLLQQNDLDNEKRKLQILIDGGKALDSEEVLQAQNRIAKLQDAVKVALKDKKPQNIYELLFPDDDKGQKLAKGFMSALTEVGKAVTEYTNMIIQQYQAQINAANKRVSADDSNIKSLQDQLSKEQALKEKGLANNVKAIKADIEQQRQLREKDVKERDEAQKRLEKVQKAQAAAQTVLQVANLLTASTEIYLTLSELGPIGVGIAATTIAAMFAAFAASKITAANAANQKFGDGGEIDGKSHNEGGKKYYSPNGGGVVELEGGEFVVNKSSTKKYKSLIKAINDDNLDDFKIAEMLAGLGIHMQVEEDQKEALKEARIHTHNQINFVAPTPATPAELRSINENVAKLVGSAENAIIVTEDEHYIYTRKGNRITKRSKK